MLFLICYNFAIFFLTVGNGIKREGPQVGKISVFFKPCVGGQNSSSQFISRVGTASSGFGVVGGKMGK